MSFLRGPGKVPVNEEELARLRPAPAHAPFELELAVPWEHRSTAARSLIEHAAVV